MLLAHNVGGGALPAPPWLLAYIGAFAVIATAVALRTTWTAPRLTGFAPADSSIDSTRRGRFDVDSTPTAQKRGPRLHGGQLVGLTLFALTLVAALVGPDSAAANVAPVAVLVIWWVGLPIVSLLAGDVMRAINPFVAAVSLVDRRVADRDRTGGPAWTGAAFLATFGWFFIAYHRPGSPRALAVFLIAYAIAAVLGGLRWGRGWLVAGEGFGALSAGVALLSPRRRHAERPPGLAALMIVWIGATAFDAFTSTPFWVDVVGARHGWDRTLVNTIGIVWVTAVVAGVYLVALRIAERGVTDEPTASLAEPLGAALVPLGLGWFLAHDLTLLLFEGQNFIALASDPIGKGWDLFGTINRTIDYGIARSSWVRWTQLGLLAAGHVAAVVIAHDVGLRLVRRRLVMRATWAVAAAATASIVASALTVLG